MIARLAALLAALSLAACANTRPESGALVPAPTLASATQHTILAATTRGRDPGPAMFAITRLGPREVDFAAVTVSVPPAHVPGEIQWPARVPGNPATDFTTTARSYLTLAEFRAALAGQLMRRPEGQRDVLLFVHGYNTEFDEGLYRLAQFAHDSGYTGVPVLFSLASTGSIWGYAYDRDSASLARDGLQATIDVIASDPHLGRLNILAHSIGAGLLMETLRQASLGRRMGFAERLGEIVLAAPDIDVAVFRSQLDAMGGRMPARTALFVSDDDGALGISTTLAANAPRLGAYAKAGEFAEAGITVIDLSAVDAGSTSMMSHDKVFASEGVAQLVGAGLARGDRLGENAPSRADRVAQGLRSFGQSLGGAVSAVLNVIVVEPARAVGGR